MLWKTWRMSVIQLREILLMLDPLLLNRSMLPKRRRFLVLRRMLILFKVTIVLSMSYLLLKIELFWPSRYIFITGSECEVERVWSIAKHIIAVHKARWLNFCLRPYCISTSTMISGMRILWRLHIVRSLRNLRMNIFTRSWKNGRSDGRH